MISINLVLIIILLHFFSEYLLQPPTGVTFTGNSPRKIVSHCICHAIPFGVFGAHFMILTCLFHFIVEMSTDRIISQYWTGNRIRLHRIYIGVSQTMHVLVLFLVYNFLGINYILIDYVKNLLNFLYST